MLTKSGLKTTSYYKVIESFMRMKDTDKKDEVHVRYKQLKSY